jgi:hypothetical protein
LSIVQAPLAGALGAAHGRGRISVAVGIGQAFHARARASAKQALAARVVVRASHALERGAAHGRGRIRPAVGIGQAFHALARGSALVAILIFGAVFGTLRALHTEAAFTANGLVRGVIARLVAVAGTAQLANAVLSAGRARLSARAVIVSFNVRASLGHCLRLQVVIWEPAARAVLVDRAGHELVAIVIKARRAVAATRTVGRAFRGRLEQGAAARDERTARVWLAHLDRKLGKGRVLPRHVPHNGGLVFFHVCQGFVDRFYRGDLCRRGWVRSEMMHSHVS